MIRKKKELTKSETHSLNPWGNRSPHLQRGQRGTESSQSAFSHKLWHHDGHLVSNRRSSSEDSEGLCSLCLPPDLPYPDSCPEIPTGCPRPSCEPVARVLSDVWMTGGRRKKENRMWRGITQKKCYQEHPLPHWCWYSWRHWFQRTPSHRILLTTDNIEAHITEQYSILRDILVSTISFRKLGLW